MGKNDRVFQVVIAVLVIILFCLCGAIYTMSGTITSANERAVKAEANAKEELAKTGEAVRENISLKQMIGNYAAETTLDTIEKAYNDDMKKYMAGYPGTDNSFRRACEFLRSEVGDRDKKIDALDKNVKQLEANLENTTVLYQAIAQKHDDDRNAAFTERDTQRDADKKVVDDLRGEVGKIQAEKERISTEAGEQVASANEERDQNIERARSLAIRNREIGRTLHELTRSEVDEPCGKITGVNQGRGIVFLDRGAADGLMVRTIFTVYDPTITGISYPVPAGMNEGDNICIVCKREMSLSASKASVEVTKILGEHAAEARILDDHLSSPIMPGDVIFTPIWKPGQKQVFALTNGMVIPGLGKRDGSIGQGGGELETVINLIKSNGGKIGAYVDDEGKLVGEIDRNTSFLVLGDVSNEDAKGEAMEQYTAMKKTADELGIRSITLSDLLNMMRWKNVTPVKGYGEYATEADIRMEPKRTSNVANGNVSSLYDTENEKARVKNSERMKPVADGKVSPLFDKRSGPGGTGTSSGSVSDLFRPRKPAVSKDAGSNADGVPETR